MATVVIVPGSFSPSELYILLQDRLESHGIPSVVVDLPSVGHHQGKRAATMTDDANEISRVASALLDDGKEVVLMAHSYGGIPATQSLEKLSHTARRAAGKDRGVKKVVYLASVVIPVGTSNWDTFGGTLPTFVTANDDYMSIDPVANAPQTFSDLPEEESLKWGRMLSQQSIASFQEKLSYPGYNDVEVHYIVCEDDKIMPPPYQHAMIETVKKSSGREPVLHISKSGHVPVISQPDSTAKILKHVIESA
ncbi:alpha/beta-hydrolase [Durotheca rogersii]|uniref:alpha/beta-hydrolase n=1 Tax=Durotheca rogersii TaxID=419775 RepID=UPI002220D64B|nr:alpha/beta-hydrolase [Durotheca rogersii]KAI5868240.1 alpha/beta-hydrolase [Durotheca rogersii]